MTVNLVLVGRVVKDGVEGSKTCIIVLLVLVSGVVVMAGGGVMVPMAHNLLLISELRRWPARMCGDTRAISSHRVPIRIGAGFSDSCLFVLFNRT